jgi:tRNA (cmo5U34)-methyltransferase
MTNGIKGCVRPIVDARTPFGQVTGFGTSGDFKAKDVTKQVAPEYEGKLAPARVEVEKAKTRSAVASKTNYNVPTKPAKRLPEEPRAERRAPTVVKGKVTPAKTAPAGKADLDKAIATGTPEVKTVTQADIDAAVGAAARFTPDPNSAAYKIIQSGATFASEGVGSFRDPDFDGREQAEVGGVAGVDDFTAFNTARIEQEANLVDGSADKTDHPYQPMPREAHGEPIPGDAYAAYGGDNIQNAMSDALKLTPAQQYEHDRDARGTRGMDIPVDWSFHNQSIADNFDLHVREQLPWYDMATGLVAHFGRHYLPQGGRMYDMGASTGNITLALKKEIEKRGVRAVSLDNSQEMANVWRGVGEFEVADVRDFEYQPYDFGVCFLLLMFLPPMEQRDVLKRMVDKLNPGGCLVIFDKTDTFDGYLGTVTHRLTLAGKVAAGVPADEIILKELSLAGAQRPIRPDMLLFTQLGAREVFRFGEFAGWCIVK